MSEETVTVEIPLPLAKELIRHITILPTDEAEATLNEIGRLTYRVLYGN